MNKHHQFIVGPLPGLFIQYPKTFGLQPLYFGLYVRYFKGDMVYPFPPSLDKSFNRAVCGGRLQQLYFIGTCPEERGAHPFRRYFLLLITGCSQQLLIKGTGRFQILYGNPYMFYFQHYLGFCHEFTQ